MPNSLHATMRSIEFRSTDAPLHFCGVRFAGGVLKLGGQLEDARMAPLVRWTETDGLGLSTPLTVFRAAARDRDVADRHRVPAAESTDLFDMARRQALMRWRGLTPDHHLG